MTGLLPARGGEPGAELSPWRSADHAFGAELRRRRRRAGLSLDALGERVHYSAALIGRVEKGERSASERLARAVDEALAANGILLALWQNAADRRGRRSRRRLCLVPGLAARLMDSYALPDVAALADKIGFSTAVTSRVVEGGHPPAAFVLGFCETFGLMPGQAFQTAAEGGGEGAED